MTTIQKTLIVAAVAATIGTAYYQAHQASRLRDEVQTLQQQQAALAEQVERANSDNASLSNRVAREGLTQSVNTERLRELLRLRGEVGVLRRRQRELEQTLAAAGSKEHQDTAQSASTAAQPPGALAPFQVMLVADELGENTEEMTYNASTGTGETLHLDKTPLMDYTSIRSATVTKNDASGTPEINVELSPEGKDLFTAITREHINQRLAILLNGRLYAAPIIRSEISDGKAQITGNFSEEEAQELAAGINQAILSP